MKRLARPIRLLIVAALVMSVGVAAVFTPVSARMLATGGQPKSAGAVPVRKDCCCGTKDGRCCGMGCCMRPTSNQKPTNPPLPDGSERNLSLALGLNALTAASIFLDHGRSDAAAHAMLDGPLSVGTLQLQHVRIQT